ncbi:GlsB/YeaQ/YmgE family stress response membrane protein [Kluyvera intermedia]|uniref:GlsB/YeaQ/YmgE family stress response membrane protein n=1 Tax=Kluyvera intermedia TaxID=61648 RepID=UPI00372D26E3
MGFIYWVFFGLVVGIIARCLMPGKEHFGIIMTVVLGVVGALIGGAVSTFLGFGNVNGFNIYSIVVATVGSIVLLFVIHKLKTRNKL